MFARFALPAALLAAGPAFAQDVSPWSFSGSVGADIPVAGEVHGAGTSSALTLSAINPALSGTGILRIRGRDYADLYDTGVRADLEVRYAATDTTQFFAALTYLEAKAKDRVDIGCVDITTSAGTCEAALLGTFSDLRQIGLEVGYRQWFGDFGAFNPYFAVRGGLTRTDAISVALAIPTASVASVNLYDETYSFMIGADLGATMALSSHAQLGGEVGLRYVSRLDENDAQIAPLGLGNLNDSDTSRLSVPISVRLNAAF